MSGGAVHAAASRVVLATGLVAIMGLARDVTLARTLGVSASMDAFVLVLGLALALGQPLASAAQLQVTPLLPALAGAGSVSSLGRVLLARVRSLLGVALLGGLGIVGWIEWGGGARALGIDGVAATSLRGLVLALAWMPLGMLLAAIWGLGARARGSHVVPTLLTGLRSLGLIVFVLVLFPRPSVVAAALGMVGGLGLEVLGLAWVVGRRGSRYAAHAFPPAEVEKSRGSAWASVIVPLLPPVAFLIDKWVATGYVGGGAATLEYAYKLMSMPHSLVAMSVVLVAFVEMARHFDANHPAACASQLSMGLRLIVGTMVPIAVALACLGPVASRILFGGAAIEATDLGRIGVCVGWYAVGLLPMGIGALFIRVAFLVGEQVSAAVGTVLLLAVNAALDLWLVEHFGLPGIAAVTSIVSGLWVAWLAWPARTRLVLVAGVRAATGAWRSLAYSVLASGLLGLAVWRARSLVPTTVGADWGLALVGGGLFALLAWSAYRTAGRVLPSERLGAEDPS